jgi:hypothetical protein
MKLSEEGRTHYYGDGCKEHPIEDEPTNITLSEAFEGEGSSLRKTFDEAVAREKKESWEYKLDELVGSELTKRKYELLVNLFSKELARQREEIKQNTTTWLDKFLPEQIKDIEEEINRKFEKEFGDFCHEQYLGCHQENDRWHYSYKNEVCNMVDEYFINKIKDK